MTDQDLRRQILLILGGVVEGIDVDALINQEAAIEGLILDLETRKRIVSDKRRVLEAQQTAAVRIKPSERREYMTHLRHCYGLDYDSVFPGQEPTERYRCKYGEDDICPGAMFEDPWVEYLRIEKEEDSKSG